MNVFDALSRHIDWASQRYAVAAQNIANLDTPGYRAKQTAPFELEADSKQQLTLTNVRHLGTQDIPQLSSFEIGNQNSNDESHSHNNVSVENEMKTVAESARSVSSSTALYKLFHRLTIASTKG